MRDDDSGPQHLSGSVAMIVTQQTTKSFPSLHLASLMNLIRREADGVANSLVIPFGVIVDKILLDDMPE
jgi:hypothetical protein